MQQKISNLSSLVNEFIELKEISGLSKQGKKVNNALIELLADIPESKFTSLTVNIVLNPIFNEIDKLKKSLTGKGEIKQVELENLIERVEFFQNFNNEILKDFKAQLHTTEHFELFSKEKRNLKSINKNFLIDPDSFINTTLSDYPTEMFKNNMETASKKTIKFFKEIF